MSCNEHDDMDVVVQVRKINSTGEEALTTTFPCPVLEKDVPFTSLLKVSGAQGYLRASHRVSRDDSLSSADGQEVFYKHDKAEKVKPGTIVPLEITLWPMGLTFGPGEGLVLKVSGHGMNGLFFYEATEPEDWNVGNHTIHTGGEYDSHLILPIVSGPRS